MCACVCLLTLTNILLVGERLRNIYVEVLSGKLDSKPALCYYEKGPCGWILEAYCKKPLTGSWLKIRKVINNPNDGVLTMCEVVVIATQVGKQSGDGFSSRL